MLSSNGIELIASRLFLFQVSYKNNSEEPTLLTLPGCIALCPLNQFIALTKDVVPVNWEKECAVEWDKLGYNINTTAVIGTHSFD